jgi:hypothetical protein
MQDLARGRPSSLMRLNVTRDQAGRLLAVADRDGVEERGDGLGVRRDGPAGDHERVVLPAIAAARRGMPPRSSIVKMFE